MRLASRDRCCTRRAPQRMASADRKIAMMTPAVPGITSDARYLASAETRLLAGNPVGVTEAGALALHRAAF